MTSGIEMGFQSAHHCVSSLVSKFAHGRNGDLGSMLFRTWVIAGVARRGKVVI